MQIKYFCILILVFKYYASFISCILKLGQQSQRSSNYLYIYIATPETDARRQDKGKSRILELIENEESAILAKKTPGVSLSIQEISEIVVPVLIYTDDKNDTKSILNSGSIEKYEVFEHIDFVYAHINKSTLDALDLNSNTIFLFENKIFYAYIILNHICIYL